MIQTAIQFPGMTHVMGPCCMSIRAHLCEPHLTSGKFDVRGVASMQPALRLAYPLTVPFMSLCLLRRLQSPSVEALYAAGESQQCFHVHAHGPESAPIAVQGHRQPYKQLYNSDATVILLS